MKTSNKREFQETSLHHSSDIDFKDFIKTYQKGTIELQNHIPFQFLVNDTSLPSNDLLRFRKNLLK